MNLVDAKADRAQSALLEIANEHPDKTLSEARHLRMPAHHEVHAKDVDLKRLGAVLAVAYERGLQDFAELLLAGKTWPTHTAIAGARCGGGPWRAEPFQRSGTILIRARRQGRASASRPLENLR